ncbi:hypothetical protein P886_2395 [Alteromonadaceae bacterium 2753L.S.0a.02]|nr:hypothetical protein P886_2395 [Alteromonadaceae bacterium 2753L.S.0a.02]
MANQPLGNFLYQRLAFYDAKRKAKMFHASRAFIPPCNLSGCQHANADKVDSSRTSHYLMW